MTTVNPGDTVSVSLGWSFTDGFTCGEIDPATGQVTATWTLTGLDLSEETCLTGCDVSISGTTATVVVPADAIPNDYLGSISLNWVPQD